MKSPYATWGRWSRLHLVPAVLAILLVSCSKPAPLSRTFRPSALDSAGLVLQLRNTSSKNLSCAMTATNKTDRQVCRHSFSLGPNASVELGIIETGWSFKSGESVEIKVEGHRSLDFKVP
jgi:hypothetical protein